MVDEVNGELTRAIGPLTAPTGRAKNWTWYPSALFGCLTARYDRLTGRTAS